METTSVPAITANSAETVTLLLSAVPTECELLCQALDNSEAVQCGHLQLQVGTMTHSGSEHYAIGWSGLGKASAAAAVATVVNNMALARVIMIGCAGAFVDGGLEIGDIALATTEICADEGVITATGFLNLQQLDFALVTTMEEKYYHRLPCDNAWLDNNRGELERYAAAHDIQCICGPFATVSSCSGTCEYGEEIYRRTAAIAENMEGSAAAQVCAQYNVPFTELRAVSNMVEERNMANWDLAGAMRRAQHCLLWLLNPV